MSPCLATKTSNPQQKPLSTPAAVAMIVNGGAVVVEPSPQRPTAMTAAAATTPIPTATVKTTDYYGLSVIMMSHVWSYW